MSPRWLIVELVLAAGVLSAQATPEVRGFVYEQGPNTGLAGAEVVLTEFIPRGNDLDPRVFATVFTDARGAFSFKPGHLGDFRLDVKKAGYTNRAGSFESSRGAYLVLSAQQPSQQFSFYLMRPASLTGRVVDEDGKPVANFPVAVTPSPGFELDVRALTDQDGVFNAKDLSPGSYLVRVTPKSGAFESVMDFSEDAFKIVDRDFAVSYWPGDAPDARSALPMTVAPGVDVSVGTITLRTTNYYRVHISITGECAAGERWTYGVFDTADPEAAVPVDSIPCAKELLFRNFKSGSRTFTILKEGPEIRWASAPVEITNANVHVEFTLSPGTDIPGRLIVPEGTAVPALARANITLQPEPRYLTPIGSVFNLDADRKFIARGLPWTHYRVGSIGIPASHYIKEIRYNGVLLPDGILTLSLGAPLEIVVDDHPAIITGTVVSGDKLITDAEVFLVKSSAQPSAVFLNPPFSFQTEVNGQGAFQFSGLAPGEYRIVALSVESFSQGIGQDLYRITSRGEKITLERGAQQTIQLKLTDPSR